jgi:hypothetical protein
MTLLTHRGQGPAFGYAGQSVHVLAGQGGLPPGFAAMELTVPPHFAGPIPHAHDEFDEAGAGCRGAGAGLGWSGLTGVRVGMLRVS